MQHSYQSQGFQQQQQQPQQPYGVPYPSTYPYGNVSLSSSSTSVFSGDYPGGGGNSLGNGSGTSSVSSVPAPRAMSTGSAGSSSMSVSMQQFDPGSSSFGVAPHPHMPFMSGVSAGNAGAGRGYSSQDADTEVLDDEAYSEDDYLDADGDGERESSADGASGKRGGGAAGGGGRRSSSEDASKDPSRAGGTRESSSPKKKPRVTLARGGACVACRNRKLKCTGEKPCNTCRKANLDCRYEEIPRKKPRATLLEERVIELESLLLAKGETLPPSALNGPSGRLSPKLAQSPNENRSGAPLPGEQPTQLSLMSFNELSVNNAGKTVSIDIPPHSALETALIQTVLPHTPHLAMPIHPQRFMALLSLPANDPGRPHPALLYILFAEAVLILENDTPRPSPPATPYGLFAQNLAPEMPAPVQNPQMVLSHVRGMSSALLERARLELDKGIRNVDRPFDLCRAAVGIARMLYSIGRFIEGWNIPVARLLVSCGLHRMTGNIVSPDGNPNPSLDFMPKPYGPANFYAQTHTLLTPPSQYPVMRMRPVIIPPARDEIELAERNLLFWAAKSQDWAASVGWGWSTGLADDEATTEWPWGNGSPEPKPAGQGLVRYGIRDVFDPSSPMHSSPFPETTFTLAMKSVALLARATHLFDLPSASIPVLLPDGRQLPTHIAPLQDVLAVQQAIENVRKRIPYQFMDHSTVSTPPTMPMNVPPSNLMGLSAGTPMRSPSTGRSDSFGAGSSTPDMYDGFADPWWCMLHYNLYTAEMMMWKEMAHHSKGAYETAVSCARAIVGFTRRMRPESWVHLDMIVALNLSLASRFLFKESDRLAASGQIRPAQLAAEEAECLKNALARDYAKWLPMASLQALIIQRVREGWAEKEGEYERV